MPIQLISHKNSRMNIEFPSSEADALSIQNHPQETVQHVRHYSGIPTLECRLLKGLVERRIIYSEEVKNKVVIPEKLSHLMETMPPEHQKAEHFFLKATLQKAWCQQINQTVKRAPDNVSSQLLKHYFWLQYQEITQKPGEDKPHADSSVQTAGLQMRSIERLKEVEARVTSTDTDDILSSWDIDQALTDAIGAMDDSYLSVYEYILDQYTGFFSDFADFKSLLAQFITPGEDGKIKVDASGIMKELEKLINKYSATPPPSDAILFPQPDEEGHQSATYEEAKKWAEEMGLDPSCVKQLADGTYVCTIDTSPLENIKQSLIDTFGMIRLGPLWLVSNKEVDPAQYQAWLAGFDMQADKFQNFMQVMTQKYTTANSVFDNLVKVLSSTITALLESDKAFLSQ